MTLQQALSETGCALFTNGDCTTSVERLTDKKYLLMTRRGLCILQCRIVPLAVIERQYPEQAWESGFMRVTMRYERIPVIVDETHR